MYQFDNKIDCLKLNVDFNITEDDYKKLKLFIEENFSEIGHFYDSPLSGYYNYSINFNIGDEYCCLTIYNNCLFIRRIYIPKSKRGRGFFNKFLTSLESMLPELGITAVCIENIQNDKLLKHLLSKGYSIAYFNYPIPMSRLDFSLPDAYKILK
ncbi:MAG: hypothetical protein ACLR3R_19950 [Clostridium paraputrificum]